MVVSVFSVRAVAHMTHTEIVLLLLIILDAREIQVSYDCFRAQKNDSDR